MYKQWMNEVNPGQTLLPDSTMFAILEHCHAQKSKALTCVDYFQAAAIDGFEEINSILRKWENSDTISLQQRMDLQTRLKATQEYLQTDFSVSLESDSSVISYCFQHALSDPDDPDFSATCDAAAPHLTVSPRCTAMSKTLEDLEKLSEEVLAICREEECQELNDFEIKNAEIQNALFHIMELKRHIVRSRWSDLEKAQDIPNLNEKRAYLTLDWAQKLLRQKYAETQSEYFGKEGMANHITHVQTDENGAPADFAIIHLIQENKQDASAVIAIILDVLLKLKEIGKEEVILRSDNAGCYHSKEVILSIAEIIEQSGVQILKYSFSEPQNGKSDSDRIAALVKNKVRAYVRETKKNVEDENQFFDALIDFPGMPHTSINVATVNRGTATKIPITALKGISKFYTFTFEDDGILVHRAANIGNGKLFEYSKTNLKLEDIPKLTTSKEHFPVSHSNFWRTHSKKKKKSKSHCSHFDCPEPACDASFETYEELMVHILSGEHYISDERRERLLQKDFAILTYQELTETRAPVPIDRVARAFQEERNAENSIETAAAVPPIRWAHRQFQKNPTITQEKRKFVYDKFLEGAGDKSKKWSAKKIAYAMLHDKENGKPIFATEEVLKIDQIKSLLSRFTAEQKNPLRAARTPPKKKPRIDCDTQNKVSNLEGDNDDEVIEECMDEHELANRYANLGNKELKYQLDNELEEMHQTILERITDE